MSDPPDGDTSSDADRTRPSGPDVGPRPYPGALDERLLTPGAPLPPGAGIRVFPPIIDPVLGPSVPASWAPDPTGRHQWRWWSGAGWTDHVADDGDQHEDPLDPDPSSPSDPIGPTP
jgi:hypothetical protein